MCDTNKKAHYRVLVISYSSMFCGSYCQFFPLSYLPEMSLWTGYPEQDKGYYVGIVASAFSIGAFLTCYMLSALADKVGFRIVTTVLLLANAVFNILFGFSRDIISYALLRFLSGTCYAIVPLSRASISHFTTDENQSSAMAIVTSAWTVGLFVASIVGGLLPSPATKYTAIFSKYEIFDTFPYVLPPAIAFILSIACAGMSYFMYPKETKSSLNDVEQTNDREHISTKNSHRSCVGANLNERDEHSNNYTQKTYGTIETDETENRENIHNVRKYQSNEHSDFSESITSLIDDDIENNEWKGIKACLWCVKSVYNFVKKSTFVKLLTNITIMKCMIALALHCVVIVAYVEVYAIWASTIPSLGGLGYSTNEIGTVLTIIAIPSTVLSLLVISPVERKLGTVRSIVLYTAIETLSITLTPSCRLIANDTWRWIAVIGTQFVAHSIDACIISAIFSLLAKLSPVDCSGSVFGLVTTMCELENFIAPLVAGIVFFASITSDLGPPFDYNLVFILLSAIFLIIVYLVYSTNQPANSRE